MRMLSLRWVAAVLSASWIGCGASTPLPVESSSQEAPEPTDRAGPAEPAPEEPPPASGGVAGRREEDLIPDDYAIMRGDCDQLGRQLAALTRSDQGATLSPKLTAAQRAQGEKNIDDVATRLGNQWTAACEKSLVGKSIDRKALRCAFEARSVKAFDTCLNGPGPSK